MKRALSRLVTSVTAAALLAAIPAGSAQASPSDSCRWLHGDDYCREAVAPRFVPDTTVGPKPPPRDCTAGTRQDPDTYGPCGWVDERVERWS